MATFFYDFSQDGEILPDSQGLNFETVERAYLEAYEAALEMWGELLRQRRDPRRCAFRVRDGNGALMFTFPFAEVLESCHRAPRPRPTFTATYHQAVSVATRARQVRAELERELNVTRAALREAASLISRPI